MGRIGKRWLGAVVWRPAPRGAQLPVEASDTRGMRLPDQVDWVARPLPWRAPIQPARHVSVGSGAQIGRDTKLFHDAEAGEVDLSQTASPVPMRGASHGLELEVGSFDGSFLSLVHDLPAPSLATLSPAHVFSVHLDIVCDRPVAIYARLNIAHGPNTEQMLRAFARDGALWLAEVDLAETGIRPGRATRAWVDLIFEAPGQCRIALGDMYMVSAPRADL